MLENLEQKLNIDTYYAKLSNLDFNESDLSNDLFSSNVNESNVFKANPQVQLLSQLKTSLIDSSILENISNAKVVEPYKGLYVLLIPYKQLQTIRSQIQGEANPNIRGLAVDVPNGTSFIILPTYESTDSNNYENLVNLRHEASHILFFIKFLSQEDLSKLTQEECVLIEYIDELLASICGENAIYSYSRSAVYSRSKLDSSLIAKIDEIYDLFTDIRNKITSNINYSEIIRKVVKLKSLSEFIEFLEELRDSLPDKSISTGWDSI